jgi:hypothetical protein
MLKNFTKNFFNNLNFFPLQTGQVIFLYYRIGLLYFIVLIMHIQLFIIKILVTKIYIFFTNLLSYLPQSLLLYLIM